jgi:3-phenylpropionate/trans-cinnamate dioxygenase ferredoxin reductase subunit
MAADDSTAPEGPDFSAGVPQADLPEGRPRLGHVGDQPVLIVRLGSECFALGATCPHYGGPLGKGLVVGETIRCPLHHACFSLRSGEVLGAPALDGVSCWDVVVEDGIVRVIGERTAPAAKPAVRRGPPVPESVVIVGGGAAGHNAAEELRRRGYGGRVVIVDPDPDAACDRPNLSKDYLAGKAQEEWLHLRPPEFFEEHGLERRSARAMRLDAGARRLTLADGSELGYDALILATGAAPVRLELPGEGPPVHTLRTVADCKAIVAAAGGATRAAVIGASFIGLEVAAALRQRGLDVHVIAPERVPFEKVLGAEVGDYLRGVHEANGVTFHLERTAVGLAPGGLRLSDGSTVEAGLVVMGVGVRPAVTLAESAGLGVERGVLVDDHLRTDAPGVWAAGDIARYPDPRTGQPVRIEHWVVAGRQGRTAARNALGLDEPYRDVPFFWSWQHDVSFGYVGHATEWDEVDIEGALEDRRALVRYRQRGRTLAILGVGRGRWLLEAEAELEREVA